ncbi:phage tail protein [Providencia vermicola]|uniref:phage tail protein n=1 Tax=Providencia vermicola TaxID=333965 RepID=UPI001FCB57B3|nr:phage tail protein [Providencia vermicola]
MKYFALLTKLGENLLAQATALGTKIELTHMAVGDGGGSLPTPDTNQTKLIAEKRRAAINTLFIDEKNKNQIIAEQIIPEADGGWWIREIGLFDKAGNLIAIANCPETYKPQLAEGSGRTQSIRMVLIVSHTESVTLKIDPSVVLATREYVNAEITVLDKKIQFDLAQKVNIKPLVLNGNKPIAEQVLGGLGSGIRASAPYPEDSPIQSAFKVFQIGPDEWPTLLAFDAYAGKAWITTRKNSNGELNKWLELTGFVTPGDLNLALLKKFDKENISQQVTNDVNKVPSLDLFAKELGKKLSSVPDATTGTKGIVKISNRVTDDTTETVPTSAITNYLHLNKVSTSDFNLALLKKFDKENISQQVTNDVNKVPSLDLFAKELGKKLSSVPDATTGTKGIVKISNRAGDNTSETVPSSLVTYYLYEELGKKLSSVPDATTSTKGLVKLSNRIADAGADTVPTSALAAYLNENKINISDIANDIGSSTTKVLSQKATTDRLLGIGQIWKDVTSSRAQGTNYTNSSSKAIQVVITAAQSSAQVAVNLKLSITGVGSFQSSSYGSNADACVTCIIPPSASYSVSASGGSGISITKWLELS